MENHYCTVASTLAGFTDVRAHLINMKEKQDTFEKKLQAMSNTLENLPNTLQALFNTSHGSKDDLHAIEHTQQALNDTQNAFKEAGEGMSSTLKTSKDNHQASKDTQQALHDTQQAADEQLGGVKDKQGPVEDAKELMEKDCKGSDAGNEDLNSTSTTAPAHTNEATLPVRSAETPSTSSKTHNNASSTAATAWHIDTKTAASPVNSAKLPSTSLHTPANNKTEAKKGSNTPAETAAPAGNRADIDSKAVVPIKEGEITITPRWATFHWSHLYRWSQSSPYTHGWRRESQQYQWWRRTAGQLLLVKGPVGAGKSILASSVVQDLIWQKINANPSITVIALYFGFASNLTSPDKVLQHSLNQAGRFDDNFGEAARGKPIRMNSNDMFRTLRGLLQHVSRNGRTYFIVDGLDGLSKRELDSAVKCIGELGSLQSDPDIQANFLLTTDETDTDKLESFLTTLKLGQEYRVLDHRFNDDIKECFSQCISAILLGWKLDMDDTKRRTQLADKLTRMCGGS
ncbi:hypothetical protein QBC44DRAFT_45106 [Cladorrhinum sp. PSN332]|nr:hypothetical protein QBC44DRAFT_45106 [Cladorrhinum sp. PSN332]